MGRGERLEGWEEVEIGERGTTKKEGRIQLYVVKYTVHALLKVTYTFSLEGILWSRGGEDWRISGGGVEKRV